VKGKHALLIGGTRGVGFGTAQALAAAGAHVTIVGRNKDSGAKAASKIQDALGSSASSGSKSKVEFIQGDIGTVCTAMELVERFESQGKRFDFAVVSAATFPDWTRPLQNDDGLDKSFAIGVVGRFLVYRNMHRFMKGKARVLNVMASGHKAPVDMFDEDIATGDRNVTSLIEAMMTFGIGNEIMIESLFKYDKNYVDEKKFTMVSTHPGILSTDLHRGQGWAFDIFEYILVHYLVGISEEEAGVRQSSILVSEKLHPSGLTLVDHLGHARVYDPVMSELIEQKRDWMWSFLTAMERNHACK